MANPKPSNWTSHIQLTTSNGNIFTNAYSWICIWTFINMKFLGFDTLTLLPYNQWHHIKLPN
jgi:hypothetical protein